MPNRTDTNQADIVKVIRALGGEWVDCTDAPKAGFDGVTLWRGRSLITEIKDGSKPQSARKLTDNEKKTQAKCELRGVPYLILLSVDHAIETLREFR